MNEDGVDCAYEIADLLKCQSKKRSPIHSGMFRDDPNVTEAVPFRITGVMQLILIEDHSCQAFVYLLFRKLSFDFAFLNHGLKYFKITGSCQYNISI